MMRWGFCVLMSALILGCSGDPLSGSTDAGPFGSDLGFSGNDCRDGGRPFVGPTGSASPLIVASKQLVQAMVLDSTHIYWTSQNGTIVKASLDGKVTATVVSGRSRPWGLAVDASNLYWIEGTGDVMSASLAGQNVKMLAHDLHVWPTSLAIGPAGLYWATDDGSIVKYSFDKSAVSVILSGESAPKNVLVDSANVYWSASSEIRKASLSGQGVSTIAAGQCGVNSMSIDSTSVYWVTECDPVGTVMKASLSGQDLMTIAPCLPTGPNGPYKIAVDNSSIYWTNGGSRSVVRTSLSGEAPFILAMGQDFPNSIAVGSSGIYWANTGAHNSDVLMLPK